MLMTDKLTVSSIRPMSAVATAALVAGIVAFAALVPAMAKPPGFTPSSPSKAGSSTNPDRGPRVFGSGPTTPPANNPSYSGSYGGGAASTGSYGSYGSTTTDSPYNSPSNTGTPYGGNTTGVPYDANTASPSPTALPGTMAP